MCKVKLSDVVWADPSHVVVFFGRGVVWLSVPAVDDEHIEFYAVELDRFPGRQVERHHIGVFEVRRAAIVYQLPRYETD